VLLAMAMTPSAFAQPQAGAESSHEASAAAQRLFDEALIDLGAGRGAAACPKFRRSFELDPKGSTLSNLGACYEGVNMAASAWAAYQELLVFGRGRNRPELVLRAQEKIAALSPKIIRIVVKVAAIPPGFRLTRNRAQLSPEEWSTPIFVDAGKHTFEATAPEFRPWRAEVTVATPGETKEVIVPALGPLVLPAEPAAREPALRFEPEATRPSGMRIAGVVLLGAGAAGLAAGTVFGLLAGSTYRSARDTANCTTPVPEGGLQCAIAPDLAKRERAVTDAAISTIGFIGGGALIGAGLLLFFAAPKHAPKVSLAPQLAPRAGGLVLRGQF
jgi:hypothetical protein